jgi:hypothetical protein
MNILVIVIKHTACLDFALPILWKIKRENPKASISVLYCSLSRKKLLRKSRFYSRFLKKYRIPQYDFADFLKAPYGILRGLWRRIFGKSFRDSHTTLEMKLIHVPIARRIARDMRRFYYWLDSFIIRKVKVERILPSLEPDIVLFDNTSNNFYGQECFYDYFRKTGKKVVLLPHAPHHAWRVAFTPLEKDGEQLPDYCRFWMPFKFERAWEALPERKSQFSYIGYPGLDSEWIEHVQSGGLFRPACKPGRTALNKPLKCLFVIRTFLSKNQHHGPDHDAFIYNYDEFLSYLKLVRTALEKAKTDIELIIKPHPSQNYSLLKEALADSGMSNYRFTYDSIYDIIPDLDCVISLYSTVFFIPAMAGIPVVLLHSSTQSVLHQWDKMEKLYAGFHFYLENPDDLPDRFQEVIDVAVKRRQTGEPWKVDMLHLRKFYPDGATEKALKQLENYIHEETDSMIKKSNGEVQ